MINILGAVEAETEVQTSVINGQQELATSGISTYPSWLIVLIILFVVLLFYLVFNYIYRNRMGKQIDKLEYWKIELENKPFSSQLSRVKDLTMSGQTEERFTKWKTEWESILTTQLPEIEETLIDIEDYVERLRFMKANSLVLATKGRLSKIEKALDHIVEEIDELTTSEKECSKKVYVLHEQFQEMRNYLEKNSDSLGVSYPTLQEKLSRCSEWFDLFSEAHENGDYLIGEDWLKAIELTFEELRTALDSLPRLMKEMEQTIPEKLREIQLAIQEMRDKDYVLEHTPINTKLEELYKKQEEVVHFAEKALIDELKEWVRLMYEKEEEIYSILEQEVEQRNFVLQAINEIPDKMEILSRHNEEIMQECKLIKLSYSWDQEREEELADLSSTYEKIAELYQKLIEDQENILALYPKMKQEIELFNLKQQELLESLLQFKHWLGELREGELQAIQLEKQMKKELSRIKINIRKHNLPGVPDHLRSGLELAEESVFELSEELKQVPIQMNRVNHFLREAKSQVESVSQAAVSIIQQSARAEQLIQYTNRYRRDYPEISHDLEFAEKAFREWQYREAVELVEGVLDRVDKEWRDREVAVTMDSFPSEKE